MPRAILYDGTRLFLGASVPAPRGIDRVDLLYARHLFEHWRGDCHGLLPTPWGIRLYGRRRSLRVLDAIEARWRETTDAGSDAALHYVERRLADDRAVQPIKPAHKPHGIVRAVMRELSLLSETGVVPGASVVRTAAEGAIYLNIGQLGWAVRWTTGWLRHRPDIRAVFMLHDTIPIVRPELSSPSGRTSHRRMVDIVNRHATGLITTTRAASDAVHAATKCNQKLFSYHSSHLPVAPVFLQKDLGEAFSHRQEYFLVCGAIEPRKNHLMLLDVWQRLVRRRGMPPPLLIIAGTSAYRGRGILRTIAQHHELRPFVVVVSGLSSPGLRRLIVNATALLVPSLAEGFGLPVAEALAVGTPVLASDLAAHREVGGHHAEYLDPADAVAWFDWICRMADDPLLVATLRRRAASFRPMTTDRYFAQVQAFLEAIP